MNNAQLAKPVPFSPGYMALLQAGTDFHLRPEPVNLLLRSGAASSGLELFEVAQMTASNTAAVAAKTRLPTVWRNKCAVLSSIWTATVVLVAVVISFSYVQLKNIQTQQTAAYDNVFVNLVRVNEEHAERTFRSVDMALRLMMHRYAQQ